MVNRPNMVNGPAVLNQQNGMTKVVRSGRDLTFSDVLKSRLEKETGVTFSAHAMDRLQQRGIDLAPDQIGRLGDAVARAESKGAQDSLVLLDNMAFIVSVENSTVVTAMSGDALRETVFTNIDSAVIA